VALVVARSGLTSSEEATPEDLVQWEQATALALKADAPEPFNPPGVADEWYTVTIANVSVGYMHTTTKTETDNIQTMEVMDVQVSRGSDTSRMAFETVFKESPLDPAAVASAPDEEKYYGGVSLMAYDQRFANNEVKMSASMDSKGIVLTSNNGEKDHITEVELPEMPWLGRLRARLEFTRQCREGKRHIVVQTMRPELGPRIVNLSSTFVRIDQVFDGEQMVDASIWNVQISDVPVNMSEAYPVHGALRCYRMLQMGLDMPFGYLLASLSSEAEALEAAKPDPNRVLPELVYTMFVPLKAPIDRVNEASSLKINVKVKSGGKGPSTLSLPTAGYQHVKPVGKNTQLLQVLIDLQNPGYATEEDLANPEFMKPSAMVDNSDEVVIDLAHTGDDQLRAEGVAVPPRGEPLPKQVETDMAYMLRDVVHNHVQDKHLSTAYASASETARTRSGDCTEHAVLLAAVLKARGIPARVCHGLVYVEQGGSAISGSAEDVTVDAHGQASYAQLTGQFGWHMWSQAMVNGRWIDLDATLHVPYSVGHVLVGTSSMSDREAHNNHMQMAALIGNLEIKVLETKHAWGKK